MTSDQLRWDQRWAAAEDRPPSEFLVQLAPRLPSSGRALDVAGGPGHDARWLAGRGLTVTLVDISSVALGRAPPGVHTLHLDLSRQPLPPGPWDVVVCLDFLERRLFPSFPERLAPGGLLVFAQPTTINLERHAHPSRRFLLEPGELATLVPPSLEVRSLTEGWTAAGRHEARLVATRPRT